MPGDRFTAYLDTCIVSGLAKGDLSQGEMEALTCILQKRKAGEVHLVTSPVVQDEISRVSNETRSKHMIIYNLLNDVPRAKFHYTDGGLMTMGYGGGKREDKLLTELKNLLPDEPDAKHLFQSAKNKVRYFITTDQKTILKHREKIQDLCDVTVLTPSEFLKRWKSDG